MEEDQSYSFSSNICLESKRVNRDISVMYRILSNMTCERKEKPRIANSDPIGKPKASGCWGKLFIDSMWLIQISKEGKIVDKKV